MIKTIISWDLGATKCAAGIIEYNNETNQLHCRKTFIVKLSVTDSFANLIEQIETGLNCKMSDADAICVGAAGNYDGEVLTLATCYPYEMEFYKFSKLKKWPVFNVIHDYAPIICATFTSYMHEPSNLRRLNHCAMNPFGRRMAIGLGTGLGGKDGVLLPNGDFWLGQNEIGHLGLCIPPSANSIQLKLHQALLEFLHADYPLTFETILSGQGSARLHQFLYPDCKVLSPEEVGIKMRENKAPELVRILAWYLGLFVGSIQLIFLPEGGIWITGGVTINHLELFDCPEFFAGIESSPAYLELRKQFPLGILFNPEHALIGGGYYAVKRLLGSPAIQHA